jgi:phosphoinositide-3-kinase regulatory subunit 4
MISIMLSRVPEDRLSFDRILSTYRSSIFPEYFYTFLKDYMASLAELPETSPGSEFLQRVASTPGTRIDRILDEWESISIYLETANGNVDPSKSGVGLNN